MIGAIHHALGSADAASIMALTACCWLLAVTQKRPTEGKSVAEFEAMLRSGDPTAQAQAALGLAKLGPAAAAAGPALAEAMASQNQLLCGRTPPWLLGKSVEAARQCRRLTSTHFRDARFGLASSPSRGRGAWARSARACESGGESTRKTDPRWE